MQDDVTGVQRLQPVLFEDRRLYRASGRIERTGDADLFQFTVDTGGTYRIGISSRSAAFDSVLTLIGRDGRLLKQLNTADNSSALDELLVELEPGRYRIKVGGHAGLRGSYELSVDQVLNDLV